MTQKKSVALHVAALLAGIALIALLGALVSIGRVLSASIVYVWASIIVMYSSFFCPFILSLIPLKDDTNKKHQLTMVWLGILIFVGLSIGITVCVAFKIFQIGIAVVVECVLAFLLAVDIYVCYFAEHRQSSEPVDEKALLLIRQIRSSMETLCLKASSLTATYEAEKKQIAAFKDTAQQMNLVDDIAAVKFEQAILTGITAVSSACDTTLAGGDSAELKKQLAALDSVIKQRMAMQKK